MILFVGTEPQQLTSALYLAQALDSGSSNRVKGTGPDIIEAESFEIDNLTGTLSSAMPRVGVEDLELFADGAPFPVPDRTGALIGLLAVGRNDGPNAGSARPYLLDLQQRQFTEGPLLPGLNALHFTWAGGFVVLQQQATDAPNRTLTSLIPTLALDTPPMIPPFEDPSLDVRFAGLERSSNRILLEVSNPDTGSFGIYRFDPDTGDLLHLTEGLDGSGSDIQLSPDGSQLALTVADPNTGSRSVLVFPLDAEPGDSWQLGGGVDQECFWPVWQPLLPEEEGPPNLACVCQDSEAARPDIVRWYPGEDTEAVILTEGPQPELFEGSMSGLTLRSRPQWAPNGELLVFGASTQEDAVDGEAMSLVALALGADSAYPIFTASEGSSGWAHFSSAVSRPHLLVWDRAATGLHDSEGSHPIQVVVADQPGEAPHPIVLGEDLFVAYPQYLGSNTMLYP